MLDELSKSIFAERFRFFLPDHVIISQTRRLVNPLAEFPSMVIPARSDLFSARMVPSRRATPEADRDRWREPGDGRGLTCRTKMLNIRHGDCLGTATAVRVLTEIAALRRPTRDVSGSRRSHGSSIASLTDPVYPSVGSVLEVTPSRY